MDTPTTPSIGYGARLIWADTAPGTVGGTRPQGELSPVLDRPDRRTSPWLRARSFLTRPRFQGSLLRAGAALLREEFSGLRQDLAEALNPIPRLTAVHTGIAGLARAGSVAAFVHYAPVAAVSGMVLRRIEALRAQGFAVVFISMAPAIPPRRARSAARPLRPRDPAPQPRPRLRGLARCRAAAAPRRPGDAGTPAGE